jgi:hypothetical protein
MTVEYPCVSTSDTGSPEIKRKKENRLSRTKKIKRALGPIIIGSKKEKN